MYARPTRHNIDLLDYAKQLLHEHRIGFDPDKVRLGHSMWQRHTLTSLWFCCVSYPA